MSVLGSLIASLKGVSSSLPDQRKGPVHDGQYAMADIGLAAFSVFFMGSPSFLAHQKALEVGRGRSNCQTLFGMTAIPTDAYIRLMLDGAPPSALDSLFYDAFETDGVLDPFRRLGGRVLVALDGTEDRVATGGATVVCRFSVPIVGRADQITTAAKLMTGSSLKSAMASKVMYRAR